MYIVYTKDAYSEQTHEFESLEAARTFKANEEESIDLQFSPIFELVEVE